MQKALEIAIITIGTISSLNLPYRHHQNTSLYVKTSKKHCVCRINGNQFVMPGITEEHCPVKLI